MSTNCLVTKLKSAVNNSNLNELGCAVLNFKADSAWSNQRKFQVQMQSANRVVKISSGDGYFTDANGDAIIVDGENAKSLTIPYNTLTTYYVSNHACKVTIEGKYNLSNLYASYSKCDVSVDDIAYIGNFAKGLTPISLTATKLAGDISNLNLENIATLAVTSSGLYGDISSITWATSGTQGINLQGTAVTGTLSLPSGRAGSVVLTDTNVVFDMDDCIGCSLNTFIATRNANVSGNADTFVTKNMTSSTTMLYLNGTSCTGSLEGVIEALWNKNKRSGNTEINISSSMKFKGEAGFAGGILTCQFTSSLVTIVSKYNTSTVYATYDGTTWTYNS